MSHVHLLRHLLRAKDLIDAHYREPLDVATLAGVAHLSPAHFSREFRRAFGEPPHRYLLTRRLERAAALLRNTDRTVADVSLLVGLRSVGSFTTSFGRLYGASPTAYRAAHPPAVAGVRVPTCVLHAYAARRGGLFFSTDDIKATYEKLKGRGVEFLQEPTEQLYGVDAGFRDTSGNHSAWR
jgi:AraC-like DNA-binding protein